MARRPGGFLEGAQATLIGLCAASLLLAVVDSRGVLTSSLRTITGTLMAPVQRSVDGITRPVGSFFADWSQLGSRKAQIRQLQQENDLLRARLQLTENDARRVAELDAMLRIAGIAQVRVMPAQVVAIGAAQGFADTVLIDAGSRDGVRVDMNVISGDGLVGRVVHVWPTQATVALITDPSSTVGARVEGSGQIGFVSGLGRIDTLQLQLLDPYAPLKVGDRLVSFGVAHGIFATGFPVGTVTAIRGKAGTSTRVADVAPFVPMGALDLVSVVLTKPRVDPRDSLLPPVPAPVIPDTTTATTDAASPQGITPIPSANASAAPTTAGGAG